MRGARFGWVLWLVGTVAWAQERPHDLLSGTWTAREAGGATVRFEPSGPFRWRWERSAPGSVERGTAWQLGLSFLLKPAPAPVGPGLLDVVGGVVPGKVAAAREERLYRLEGQELVLAGWNGRPAPVPERLCRASASPLPVSDPRVPGGNRLELLIDGPEAYPSMYQAIAAARGSICVQFFSWFDDASGRRYADALIARARSGVQVKVLMEAFPQKGGIGWKTGKHLKQGGVDVKLHHQMTRGLLNSVGGLFRKLWNGLRGKKEPPREKRGFLNHDHRKLLIVDGRVAFTGGMNVGDKYEKGTDWHDIHARVEGPAVEELEALFWDRWRAAGGEDEALPPLGEPARGPYRVEVLENLPGLRLDVTRRYMDEIRAAQEEVLIENPYFLYDPVVNALKDKARAGVRTVVIIPSNDLNDEALARDAMFWCQNDIVRAGVELRKYRDRMCHGKVAVFDRRITTVGTTNLDQLAMERNAEVNLFVPDERFARSTVQRVFAPDIAGSDQVVVQKLGWWQRLKGAVMYSMRRFL